MAERQGRRRFLAGLGGLAASAAGGASAWARPRRILVIGAGLAGLSAAQALAGTGHAVTVLEARARIGERVHTSRLWPGLPVELGAGWIHGRRGNPVTALAADAGAATLPVDGEALLIGPRGRPISPDMDRAEAILRRALREAEDAARDRSVLEALTASRAWGNASEADRRLVRHYLNATMEAVYGGPARRLSAWYGEEGSAFGGPDLLFPGGFDHVPTFLARGLDIRLSTEVTGIAPGHVTVSGGGRFEADAILCTVPLGVLQGGGVRFAEPLAVARRSAIDRLGMGLLNKVWLRFERIAWPRDVDWIGRLAPAPGPWPEWVSLARVPGVPVLGGLSAADHAEALEAMDDRATVAAATEALRGMFGTRFPAPLGAQVTRWRRDPFSLGSYSFNAVGTRATTRDALRGPDWDGRLWFAGEATSAAYYGTAHGAVLEGRAIAGRIAAG
jgi:monoamine oxidase